MGPLVVAFSAKHNGTKIDTVPVCETELVSDITMWAWRRFRQATGMNDVGCSR